jgi:hypothetical protein
MADDVYKQTSDNAKTDLNIYMQNGADDQSSHPGNNYSYGPIMKDRQGRNVLDHTTTHRPNLIGPKGWNYDD